MPRAADRSVAPEPAPTPDVPLVSVIVATNRSSPFLREALESVAQQTHPKVELIVVDDGADDPVFIERAVAEHSDGRVVRLSPSGVSTARNTGASHAQGELLVFLDDDDRWRPDRLELQARALAAEPDAVVAYCAMQSIDESGAVVAAADQVAVAGEVDVARRMTGIILPNVMIRAVAFEKVGGFDSALQLAEDLDLILSLASLGRFVFTPEVLVDYRTHVGNTTKRYRALSAAIDAVVRGHMIDARARGDQSLVAAHRESLAANHRYAWWSALRAARADLSNGHAGRAMGAVAWAVRFAPFGVASALQRRLDHDS